MTGLAWREKEMDLVSSHGGSHHSAYAMVWNYKEREFSHILTGHKGRITSLRVNREG